MTTTPAIKPLQFITCITLELHCRDDLWQLRATYYPTTRVTIETHLAQNNRGRIEQRSDQSATSSPSNTLYTGCYQTVPCNVTVIHNTQGYKTLGPMCHYPISRYPPAELRHKQFGHVINKALRQCNSMRNDKTGGQRNINNYRVSSLFENWQVSLKFEKYTLNILKPTNSCKSIFKSCVSF